MNNADCVPAAAAIIRKDNRILMAKRKRALMGASWQFPGGKHVLNCRSAIYLCAYEATYLSGEIRLTEHEEIRWVIVGDLDMYNLSDADRMIATFLSKLKDPPVSGLMITLGCGV